MTEEQKAAKRARLKAWRQANPDKARATARKYQQANKDKFCETSRRWKSKDENRPAVILQSCRKNAKTRGHECELTLEQVTELIAPMRCSVTGIELSWGSGRDHPWTPTLDRLDNARGYHLDNVRLVCWAYNKMRGVWSDELVMQVAQALVDRK